MKGMDSLRNKARLHDLIKFCFMLGLRHGQILLLLSTVDDIVIKNVYKEGF